ncbi:hypothetical protein Tco_0825802 [Tanacetum coccineum]
MCKSAERAQTPTNSIVRNTADKGSKQATDSPFRFLLEDRLCEICDKHYNQLLPIMEKKVLQKKLQEKKGQKKAEAKSGHHVQRHLPLPKPERLPQTQAQRIKIPPAEEALLAPRCSPN